MRGALDLSPRMGHGGNGGGGGSGAGHSAARSLAAVALSGAAGCASALRWKNAQCDQKEAADFCEEANWGAHPGGIVFEGDTLLKKFQTDGRGTREAESLIILSSSPDWRPYVPRFLGLRTDGSGDQWISMESLTAGMEKPIVLDLKIGVRQYSPGASETKRRKQIEKTMLTTSASLGICIVGCKIPGENYEMDKAEIVGSRPKRHVGAEDLPAVLQRFLGTECRVRHARHFVAALLALFQAQSDYAFFGSSLLFVYDAALGDKAPLRISMVDFCHVHTMDEMRSEAENEGRGATFVPRDFSYIYGLTTLIEIFDGLLFRRTDLERLDLTRGSSIPSSKDRRVHQ